MSVQFFDSLWLAIDGPLGRLVSLGTLFAIARSSWLSRFAVPKLSDLRDRHQRRFLAAQEADYQEIEARIHCGIFIAIACVFFGAAMLLYLHASVPLRANLEAATDHLDHAQAATVVVLLLVVVGALVDEIWLASLRQKAQALVSMIGVSNDAS